MVFPGGTPIAGAVSRLADIGSRLADLPGTGVLTVLASLAVGVVLANFLVRLIGRPVARRVSRQSVAQTIVRGVRVGTIAASVLVGLGAGLADVGLPVVSGMAAGVDGALTVDMPPEEAAEWTQPFPGAGLAPILLAAPTTSSTLLVTLIFALLTEELTIYLTTNGFISSAITTALCPLLGCNPVVKRRSWGKL